MSVLHECHQKGEMRRRGDTTNVDDSVDLDRNSVSNIASLLDVYVVDVGVTLTLLTRSTFVLHGRHCKCCVRLLVHRLFVTNGVVIALIPQLFVIFLSSVVAIFHQRETFAQAELI